MKVLGLDLSTVSGVAVVESGKKVIHTEEVTFKKERGMTRCGLIAGRILEIHEQYLPDFAVIENYGFANSNSLVTLVEVGTVVRYFLHQSEIPFLLVPPNSLKKFVSGKGNSKKDEIMMHVLKNWGFESKTNNIADAVGLGMFGLGCAGEKFTLASMSCCNEVLKGQPELAKIIKP